MYKLVQLEKKIENFTNEHDCVIFSATYCPYSKRAKKILCEKFNNIKIIETDADEQGGNYRKIIEDKYNHNTVPVIFINKNFIGGLSDLNLNK